MIYAVRVKPKSKQPAVKSERGGKLVVSVTAAPTGGQANAAVVKALAEYFRAAPSRINIIRGRTSRNKQVEIN